MYRLKFVTSEYALQKVWEFPRERFVQYEPKDEGWCRYFGIGCEIERPGLYQVGDTVVMHPEVFLKLQKAAPFGRGS